MATISPTTLSCPAEPYSGKNAYLKLTITSITDSDAATNQRTIGWKITVEGTRWSAIKARYCKLGNVEIVPKKVQQITNWHAGDIIDSGTTVYDNDSAGNLTLYAYLKQLFYYSHNANSWAYNSQEASTNMVCSQLPRYANFTQHYVSATGINTFSITWGADASCDAVQYSLNGGNWTDAQWPTYTITGLQPNTSYNIRTRIKRADSQLWNESGYLYPTTSSLPNTGTPSNFNLSSSPTVSIENMNNLSYWYVHTYDGNTLINDSGALYSTSTVIDLTNATLINQMLARHPNDNDWDITFKYYCVSNGTTYTLTQRTCKCIIPSGQYTPTFTDSNISYEVTDQQSLNLTGSNKKVIKGISDVLLTISPASPNGSSSISSYNATSGNSTGSTTNTSTPTISLTNVNANSVTVQAVDSRNRTTVANKAYSTFVDYFAPTITSTSINRIDGVGSNLKVNITGNYCNWSGLSTTNVIEQVSLNYKLKTAQNYTTISGVNLTITNNNGTFTITGNITGNLFSASSEYDLLLVFKDKINNLSIVESIPTGEALLWRDKLNKRIGIKRKPTFDFDVDGDINISGNYYVNGQPFTGTSGDTVPIGAIMPYSSSSIPTNWLECNGQAISRTTYADLFAAIGTTFGPGDGSTTFNLPDLCGRIPIGYGTGTDGNGTSINFSPIASKGGEYQHWLTVNEMPSHNHNRVETEGPHMYPNWGTSSCWGAQALQMSGNAGETTKYVGGDQAHNNVQPFLTTKYIIKAFQSAGVVATVTNAQSSSQVDTYSCDYANKYYGGTVLYYNDSGNNGEVTLNESSDNYRYVEIYYRSNDGLGYINSVKVPCAGYIIVSLNISHYISSVLYTKFKEISLSSNKIQNISYVEYYFLNGTVTINEVNNIYITRVIGYK